MIRNFIYKHCTRRKLHRFDPRGCLLRINDSAGHALPAHLRALWDSQLCDAEARGAAEEERRRAAKATAREQRKHKKRSAPHGSGGGSDRTASGGAAAKRPRVEQQHPAAYAPVPVAVPVGSGGRNSPQALNV